MKLQNRGNYEFDAGENEPLFANSKGNWYTGFYAEHVHVECTMYIHRLLPANYTVLFLCTWLLMSLLECCIISRNLCIATD